MKSLGLFIFLSITSCGPHLEIERPKQNVTQQQAQAENKWFKIIVVDVGQGDATLLIDPAGQGAIIDTGPPDNGAPKILSVLEEQKVQEVKNIFISHDHEDHTGGLEAILSALKIDRSQVIDKQNAEVGQAISLGPVSIEIKAAGGHIGQDFTIAEEARNDENNLSLALLIEYKTRL